MLTNNREQYQVMDIAAIRLIKPPDQVREAKAKGSGAYAAGVAIVVLRW